MLINEKIRIEKIDDKFFKKVDQIIVIQILRR